MKRRIEYNKDLINNVKIKEVRFKGNLRAHMEQNNCYVDTKAPELNAKCAKCVFVTRDQNTDKVKASPFSRLAHELGINGYMSNQEDGLKPCKISPLTGINLRKPTTKIIQRGKNYKCHNPEATARGQIDIVGKQIPPCKWRQTLEDFNKEYK